MNDPPTKMGASEASRATDFGNSPRSLGRSQSFTGEVRHGVPDAPNSAAVGARSWSDAHDDYRARKNQNRQSWVRDKVLFLLDPERCLGTGKGSTGEEVPDGEDVFQVEGDDREPERGPPLLPRKGRISGSRVDAATGPASRDPATPPKSVLVRVVDFQVTQEVLRTAWTNSLMTTRTEERLMTAVTFRTNRQ